MSHAPPVRFGSVGLGGYARAVCDELLAADHDDRHPVQFVAVAEPQQARHPEMVARLGQAGVDVYERFEDLLECGIEAVWLPLPIHLHRPFTEQALAAGKAVLVEKPAAGCIEDVDAMIDARNRAGRIVAVGYQDIYDPAVGRLKRRLLDGAIGRIQTATLHACWPRSATYFQRNDWAGRIRCEGTWVLDSPANNALAHPVNLILFLLGDRLDRSARPVEVETELYRAGDIENFDTIGMRVDLAGGASVLVLLTHACAALRDVHIAITGESGSVEADASAYRIQSRGGTEVLHRADRSRALIAPRVAMALRRAEDLVDPLCTLEIARAHTIAVCGASRSAPIHAVDGEACATVSTADGPVRAIHDIESTFTACAAHGWLPHESGLASWTRPAARAGLRHWHEPGGSSDAPPVETRPPS